MKRQWKGQKLTCRGEKSTPIRRSVWNEEEDKLLLELANGIAERDWTAIANQISKITPKLEPIKSSKQCRERWHNRVNPSIKQSSWSKEEEDRFFDLFKVLGPKWSNIASKLPGRTDNTAKNFFFCKLRKTARRIKKGIIADDMKNTESDIDHSLFMLNYLVAHYFPHSKKAPIKMQYDKYVQAMIANGSITLDKTNNYMKEYLAAIKAHKNILSPSPNHVSETDESFSKQISASARKLPLLSSPSHPTPQGIFVLYFDSSTQKPIISSKPSRIVQIIWLNEILP